MKPLYLPTDQLVIHQINDDNPNAKISLDKVTLSAPTAIDDTGADGKKRNSKINVKARKGKGFRDAQDVKYNRLQMAALFRNTNVFLDVNEPKNSGELLAALNRGYGLSLQLSDIVLGYERNQQDEKHANRIVIRRLKDRYTGETGKSGLLEYDKDTGRTVEVDDAAQVLEREESTAGSSEDF